ncbi:SpoIIE family protein phosphatase [Umezawaea sp. Da 62-37]|uniref:SpoIIE family protein phosphatase n=1 Tax=Umezawaea sp. Da 62-37 TaxID=3075927 RepID=UPI0028F6DF27|nr:SpoIIE family protein phosphatase [Umezawaea sp. Da 62-37]WNV86115.1 SpoIIE family protein phosphatase [Umezawaea sp. Da 62-37]
MSEQSARPAVDTASSVLCDPARLRALRETGLGMASDPVMERFVAMVRVQLRVPVALVSLVESDRQVFPGMLGLPEPWASERQTPLSHSFCQHVVTSGESLVLDDARESERVRGNLAISELGVVAYAGMPLTASDGRVLGSLCAIDTVPRQWTEDELATLADLAAMCTTELRLRLATRHHTRERARVRELSARLELSHERTRILLTAAQALASTRTLEQVRHQVSDLVSGEDAPTYVGLVVVEKDGGMRRVVDARWPVDGEDGVQRYTLDAPLATAKAVRERRLVWYPDPESIAEDFTPWTVDLYRRMGLHAVVCAPLVGMREILGVLLFGWGAGHELEAGEREVITTIAAYTAQALERIRLLEHRAGVARELQEAMLTELPEVPGLRMAAHYLPSAIDEAVGGDWYDAIPLPADSALAVTVGDITGHDVHASTLMGQVRSMLRQAAWCGPGTGPGGAVDSLEAALAGIPVPAHGTLVHLHLTPHDDGSGRWDLAYTNAGHPEPILVAPDGSVSLLGGHGMLFGFPEFRTGPRTDHHVVLEPGSTVVLHTDGLVERRGVDYDDSIAALCVQLGDLAGKQPRDVVDSVIARLNAEGQADDDVVVLAIGV